MSNWFIILVGFLFLNLFSGSELFSQPALGENEYRLNAVNPRYTGNDTITWHAGRGICVADNPDLDNDNKPELLLTDYTKGGRVFVYEMTGNDQLQFVWASKILNQINIGGGNTPRMVTVGDFDNNGKQEIIFPIGYFANDPVQFAKRGIYFYEWTGNDNDYGTEPIFKLSYEDIDPAFGTVNVGRTENGIICQDIDGDGKNELIFPPRSFDFGVAKLYILQVTSGTFAGGDAVINVEYVYTDMVQPPIIAPDGYVPCGSAIGDVDDDGFDEIIVAGWQNIAAGAGIGFIQIDGPDSYTPGSIVPLSNYSAFIVKSKPLFTKINNKPVIYFHGTNAASMESQIWVVKDIVSDQTVSQSNIFNLFSNVGYWGAWALGNQDYTTTGSGDGPDIYLYNGGGKIVDIEYDGTGSISDTNSYTINQVYDLEQVYTNLGGLFNDFYTYPGMDIDADGIRDFVTSYKGWDMDQLGDSLLAKNGFHIFFFEWGDSTKSIKLDSILHLGHQYPNIVDFEAALNIADNNGNGQGLTFGTAYNATDGYDFQYDQYAPPLPPAGAFDARFRTGNEDFLKDFRATNTGTIIWDIHYQASTGGEPVMLNWDSSQLPSDSSSFYLVDAVNSGSLVNIDMRSQNNYTDSLVLGHLQIVYRLKTSFDKTVLSGWNLLGLPSDVDNKFYLSIFPNAITGTLFGFNGSYFPEDSLELGKGYWLRFPAAETVSIWGVPADSITIDMNAGWNMISGVSCSIALMDIIDPGSIIVPNTLFGFDGSYLPADSLKQGNGYWLRTNTAGQITLLCESGNTNRIIKPIEKNINLAQFPSIHITDASGSNQTLYFNVKLKNPEHKLQYSLPPVPPMGAFDARFTGDYRVEESDVATIRVQSAHYPISITGFNIPQEKESNYVIKEILDDQEVASHVLYKDKKVQISNSQVRLLRLGKIKSVPRVFMVQQNYPNPFNPTTHISYTIPEAEKVTIVIYNTLGQKVKTLTNKEQEAGYYKVSWNGTNNYGVQVGSGIYFYRVKAGKFSAMKKMILLR